MAPRPKQKDRSKEPLSFSRANTYVRCPRQYRLQYEDGLENESGYFGKQGKALHAAARVLTLAIKDGTKEFAPEDIQAAFDVAVKKHFDPGELDVDDYTSCVKWLEKYCRQTFSRAENIFRCEQEFNIDLGDGLKLRGFIDRIDLIGEDAAEIFDYKSSFFILKKEALRKDYQLNSYLIALAKLLPHIRTVTLTQYMFRQGFPNSVTVDAADTAIAKGWLVGVLDGIKERKFPARLNDYCCYCIGRGKCPAYKKMLKVELDPPTDPDSVHAELEKLSAAGTLIDKRQKLFKAWLEARCEKKGNRVPIEGGKRFYTLKPVTRRPVNVKKAAAVFAANNLDLLATAELSLSKKAFFAARNLGFEGKTEPEIQVFKEQLEDVFEENTRSELSIEDAEPKEKKPKTKKSKGAKKGAGNAG